MPLITLVVVLIVIAVLLGLVNHYGPRFHMDGTILSILNAVVVIAVILWLLALFLPLGNISQIRVGPPG